MRLRLRMSEISCLFDRSIYAIGHGSTELEWYDKKVQRYCFLQLILDLTKQIP